MDIKICKKCNKRLEYSGYGERGDNFLACIDEYKINYYFIQKEIPKDIGIKLYNFCCNKVEHDFDDYVVTKINCDNDFLQKVLKDYEFPSNKCPYIVEHIVGEVNGC